ncbi:outer membrane protein assembly factor BamE [Psychrobacter aestuarii]|nr:outer membrane protein assembly factor BamE [Psychrobacter aestuarii]
MSPLIMHKSLTLRPTHRTVRHLALTAALSATVALSGCSMLSVYKIDLPQGTPITQTQASKLRVGMNQNQVLYLLGSPAIKDTLAPNRWDYIYDYKAGTEGKRLGKADVVNASQHLSVYFDERGIVTRIDGIETLPQ